MIWRKEELPIEFGRYHLLRHLGRGGMAEVHLATIGPVGPYAKVAAVKTLHPQHRDNERIRRFFADEATIGNQLYHPNIVQTHEYGTVEGVDFIAFEYVHGKSLAELEAETTGHIDSAVHIALGLCAGMGFAHRSVDALGNPMNLIHRDISPKNVLLSYEGQVKIADFGIARADNRNSNTKTGEVKGTIRYMAPEQLCGGKVSARTDVYALGVTIFELLTGRRLPYVKSDDYFEIAKHKMEGKFPKVSELRPELGTRYDKLLNDALAGDPAQRPADGEVLYSRLLASLDEVPDPLSISQAISTTMKSVFPTEARRPPLAGFSLGSVASQGAINVADLKASWEPTVPTGEKPEPAAWTHVASNPLRGTAPAQEKDETLARTVTESTIGGSIYKARWPMALLGLALGAGLAAYSLWGTPSPQHANTDSGANTSDAAELRTRHADATSVSRDVSSKVMRDLSEDTAPAVAVKLTLNSVPSNATVTVAGAIVGKTPLNWHVPIAQRRTVNVRLSKRGYRSRTLTLGLSRSLKTSVTLFRLPTSKPPPSKVPIPDGLKHP
jgi:eukaryotic-like serine/threonine-protein kinase